MLGLDGTEYIDKTDGEQRKRQEGPVTFAAETDRIYVDTEAQCTIVDRLLKRRIHISKRGSRSTVVWNPWEKKAAGSRGPGSRPGNARWVAAIRVRRKRKCRRQYPDACAGSKPQPGRSVSRRTDLDGDAERGWPKFQQVKPSD